jgi:hypothetical protein
MEDKSLSRPGNEQIVIDLRRYPVEQVGAFLDLVSFDSFLDYVYSVLLRRGPDRDGSRHYLALSRKGMARSTIVRRLLRSSEFRLSSIDVPGLREDEFVSRVYQEILGRWPDQEGLDTYRRIATRRNGRKKVIANLLASDEALRKGGGRLARIESLRTYAAAGWPTRLPLLGRWFDGRRKRRQRFDRLALMQSLLAAQITQLRDEFNEADLGQREPYGFVPDVGNMDVVDSVFHNALSRIRREI